VASDPVAEKICGQDRRLTRGLLLSEVWPELHAALAGTAAATHIEMTAGQDNPPVYLDIDAVTLYEGRRTVAGQLVVLRNITKLKNAQNELETLYHRERRLNATLDKEMVKRNYYTRALVHELGTPLTSIITSAEVLDELEAEPIKVRLVKNILRSSANLEQRVHELLDLARGELGMLKINLELLDLNQLVQEVVAEMTPLAEKKGILLRSELCETALPARIDKKRIREVIFNLLSNALKFTREGTITVRDQRLDSDYLEVQVEDTGTGITQEQQNHLFDPYYSQSREDPRISGLGIGLTLSKMFIELHKCRILVESQPGKGSRFSFTVPAEKAG